MSSVDSVATFESFFDSQFKEKLSDHDKDIIRNSGEGLQTDNNNNNQIILIFKGEVNSFNFLSCSDISPMETMTVLSNSDSLKIRQITW